MFCEKCGSQVPDDAVFCMNCGANLQQRVQTNVKSEEKIVDNEVQLNIKPKFSLAYMTLPTLITYWGMIIIIAIIFGFVSGTAAIGIISFGIVMFIFYGIFWGIGLIIRKMQYDNYSYDFYKTKVIYKDGFLNKAEKEVKYKYIREVGMRQTFFQRFFNLGSIVLYTNAETGYANGISIVNVSNVQEYYKKIKEIIEI